MDGIERAKRSSCIQMRFLVIFLTTLCPIVCYIGRQNLAIAIVTMVNEEQSSATVSVRNLSLAIAKNTTTNPTSLTPMLLTTSTPNRLNICPAATVIGADGQEEVVKKTITYGPKYDWTSADRGLIFQAFFITYVICQIPGARLAEIIGAKWILAVSTIGSGVISFASPWAASMHLYVFVAFRAIMGACQAALYPSCYVLYSKWLPPSERSQALPFLGAGAYIGSIIASTTTGFFSEIPSLGWKWAFYMPGIFCTIWSVVWILVASSEPKQNKFISLEEIEYIEMKLEVKQTEETKSPSWSKIFSSQHIWALMVGCHSSNWAFAITLMMLPSYLNDVLNIPPFKNGLINSVIYIISCTMAPVVGAISSRMIETRPFGMTHLQTRKLFQCVALFSSSILFSILPTLGCDTYLVLGAIYAQTVLFAGVNGGEVQLPTELSLDFAGTIFAIGNCVGSSTGFLVPEVHKWIVTNTRDQHDWSIYFYVAAIVTAIGGAIFLIFAKNDLQDYSKESKEQASTEVYQVAMRNYSTVSFNSKDKEQQICI